MGTKARKGTPISPKSNPGITSSLVIDIRLRETHSSARAPVPTCHRDMSLHAPLTSIAILTPPVCLTPLLCVSENLGDTGEKILPHAMGKSKKLWP